MPGSGTPRVTRKGSAESRPGAVRGKGSRLGLISVAQFAKCCPAVQDAAGRWETPLDALPETGDPCSKLLPPQCSRNKVSGLP